MAARLPLRSKALFVVGACAVAAVVVPLGFAIAVGTCATEALVDGAGTGAAAAVESAGGVAVASAEVVSSGAAPLEAAAAGVTSIICRSTRLPTTSATTVIVPTSATPIQRIVMLELRFCGAGACGTKCDAAAAGAGVAGGGVHAVAAGCVVLGAGAIICGGTGEAATTGASDATGLCACSAVASGAVVDATIGGLSIA
jgi:hypothetical protein